MAISGSISLTSPKAWRGSIEWSISGSTLSMSLYMWKTDGTGSASSGGYTNSGTITINDSTTFTFSYNQLNYNKTQYGQTYHTTISYGTSYTISASVEGLTNTSMGGYTLSGSGTVKVNEYALSISSGTGSSISVNRTSSDFGGIGVLSNGSSLYDGDILEISFSSLTGYDLDTCTVNGSSFISGSTYTVSSNVSVSATAIPKSYILSIDAGVGSSVVVYRQSSNGGLTGNLSNGATIYYSDVLKISFSANTGYDLDTHTVNDSTFTSENTYTATGAVTVVSTALVKSYTLSISVDDNAIVTVSRTSSPLKDAATGSISNGEAIYYSDVLKISFSANAGYEIVTHTVNGSELAFGDSYTVNSNVLVAATTKLLGLVYICDGLSFVKYLVYIYNGTSWDQYMPYVYDGSNWYICS